MTIDIAQLLPRSHSNQNTHRLVVITAEAQPDEFARLEITTADALAAARDALRAFEAEPVSDRPLQSTMRGMNELVGKGRVIGTSFQDLATDALQCIESTATEQGSDQLTRTELALRKALALSQRVSDLLAAERDIGWHRGIGRDR